MRDSRFIDLSEQKSAEWPGAVWVAGGDVGATKFVELSRRIIVSLDSSA
jgi:hypothetical protein